MTAYARAPWHLDQIQPSPTSSFQNVSGLCILLTISSVTAAVLSALFCPQGDCRRPAGPPCFLPPAVHAPPCGQSVPCEIQTRATSTCPPAMASADLAVTACPCVASLWARCHLLAAPHTARTSTCPRRGTCCGLCVGTCARAPVLQASFHMSPSQRGHPWSDLKHSPCPRWPALSLRRPPFCSAVVTAVSPCLFPFTVRDTVSTSTGRRFHHSHVSPLRSVNPLLDENLLTGKPTRAGAWSLLSPLCPRCLDGV